MPPEIGSEFHWDPAALAVGDAAWLPARHELFATGCGALTALLRFLRPRGRLHVPSYFCMGVAEALSAEMSIAWYRHLPGGAVPHRHDAPADERSAGSAAGEGRRRDAARPRRAVRGDGGPHWPSLRAAAGDVVLAQNLFGRDDPRPWDAWMRAHPDVLVIEDHSHDPLSDWARDSGAHYAVASLRKTLPLPDGGMLWSPRGLQMPRPSGDDDRGAQLKLTAMLLKAAWLEGLPIPREDFRALQQRGEHTLLGSEARASEFTTAVLPLLDAAGLRDTSIRNARVLAAALPADTASWRLLGAGPFRVQLACPSEPVRDDLLRHLAANGIFAPVHWRQDRAALWSGDDEAATLAGRMLTVPVDHRCSTTDVRRIVTVLRAFADQRAERHPTPDSAPAA